jgi:hypothetical protein
MINATSDSFFYSENCWASTPGEVGFVQEEIDALADKYRPLFEAMPELQMVSIDVQPQFVLRDEEGFEIDWQEAGWRFEATRLYKGNLRNNMQVYLRFYMKNSDEYFEARMK